MKFQLQHRRECADGIAVDIWLERCLHLQEIMQLAETLEGDCRFFGNLLWVDFHNQHSRGRITASTQVNRMTLRGKYLHQTEQMLDGFLTTLETVP